MTRTPSTKRSSQPARDLLLTPVSLEWVDRGDALRPLAVGPRRHARTSLDARREIKNSGGSQTGSALAIAGIILGWAGILIPLIVLGGAAIALMLSGSSSGVPLPLTSS
jgi:hypothetical protein